MGGSSAQELTPARIAAKAPGWTPNDATKQLSTYAIENFTLPGEPGFPLNSLYAPPASRNDADALRSYLTHARQETVVRFIERVYGPDGKPSKWWTSFVRRKFMGKSLAA